MYEASGELEAATEVLAIDERSTVLYNQKLSLHGDRSGEGSGLTWGVGIAEYPLSELSRNENILDADVARGPITGLLITFHVGYGPSGGEGHIGDLVLALCLVGRVFVFV